MKMSDAGRDWLAKLEGGYRLQVYYDSGGAPTIGVGHLLTRDERSTGDIIINNVRVHYKNGLTVDQAMDLFEQDLEPVEAMVRNSVAIVLNQNQFDALCSFVFNIGEGAFERPDRDPPGNNVLRLINANNLVAVPGAMRQWVYDNHVMIKGLANRRDSEITRWQTQEV